MGGFGGPQVTEAFTQLESDGVVQWFGIASGELVACTTPGTRKARDRSRGMPGVFRREVLAAMASSRRVMLA